MQVLDFPALNIVTLPLEDDDMSNKERLDAIDSRLDRIDTALGLKPPKPKSAFVQFRDDPWQKIKAHKTTIIPIVAIAVGLGGWFVNGWFRNYLDHRYDFVDGMIANNLSKPGGIKETLGNVQDTTTRIESSLETLKPFIHDVILRQFENASKLPIATFQQRLPALKDLLSVAKNQKVKIDPKIVNQMGGKLTELPTRPTDYWQAAANLVSYRSFNTTSWTPQANLLNCTDTAPETATITAPLTSAAGKLELKASMGEYRNCRITLDSPQDGKHLNSLLAGGMASITFYRCVVVYRGGPIALILAWDNHVLDSAAGGKKEASATMSTSGNTVRFMDCIFDFSVQPFPSPQVQRLTEFLLAQNTPNINLPLGATNK